MFKIKKLAPALAGTLLLIAFTVAASEQSSLDSKQRGEIHRSIKELQNQVTELERKMQSGVVVVCNCIWDAIPIAVEESDQPEEPFTPVHPIPFRVKGHGYNSILAKWDAIDTCWKIGGYWWTYKAVPTMDNGSNSDGSDGSDDGTYSEQELAKKQELVEDQESKGMECHYIRNWQAL